MGSICQNRPTSTLTPAQIWLLAARPKTLPAAAATAITGSAAAFYSGKFQPGPALACLLGALLLQIGANLANDVFDYYRGADAQERLGPLRVTTAGLLRPGQVLAGMWLVFGLAALLGVYLALVAGWPVLLVGLACILAAVAYTGGPFPFGYYGLGDLVVFIFFGPVAVCGTYFVQARPAQLAGADLLAAGGFPDHRHPGGEQPARYRHRPGRRQADAGRPPGRQRGALGVRTLPGGGLPGAADFHPARLAAALERAVLALAALGVEAGAGCLARRRPPAQ